MFIVWPVQLSLALKTQVVAAFAFRLPWVEVDQMKVMTWLISLQGGGIVDHPPPLRVAIHELG